MDAMQREELAMEQQRIAYAAIVAGIEARIDAIVMNRYGGDMDLVRPDVEMHPPVPDWR